MFDDLTNEIMQLDYADNYIINPNRQMYIRKDSLYKAICKYSLPSYQNNPTKEYSKIRAMRVAEYENIQIQIAKAEFVKINIECVVNNKKISDLDLQVLNINRPKYQPYITYQIGIKDSKKALLLVQNKQLCTYEISVVIDDFSNKIRRIETDNNHVIVPNDAIYTRKDSIYQVIYKK